MGEPGPQPNQLSDTGNAEPSVATGPSRHIGFRSWVRPLAGLTVVVAVGLIIGLAVGLFRGSFSQTVAVTVLSPRAGLVMNPDAKVNMLGIQVGKVVSIEERPNGQAALHLAMDPSQLRHIPANVRVEITAPTVFGAKFVQFAPPADPSTQRMHAGQVIESESVTVEINSVFEQLVSVLSTIEPAKLNETLGGLAQGLNGRGHKIGQMLADFDNLLAKLDPSLTTLRHELAVAPEVLRAYGDAAQDLTAIVDNTTEISQTVVDEQQNLDAVLIGVIGLADIGNDVIGANRQPLADVMHLLVPTTDLLNEYNPALTCALAGAAELTKTPRLPEPGILLSIGLVLGVERYRYPGHLPKVAATGGPHCADQQLPKVPAGWSPPFLVTDQGANPWQYGNQGILLNSDLLKQLLYGPIDGPPRNSAQIGQPG